MHDPESIHTPNHPAAEAAVVERLMPVVYEELRRIAGGMLRHRERLSLQPTALVHEAFLRVAADCKGEWQNEAHFRAIASLAMRRVLADHVRGRSRDKRGAGKRAISLDVGALGSGAPQSATEIDAALEELEASNPRVARLVIFRFFGDLTMQQAAERLNVSLSTAETDWRFARAWMKRRLRGVDA